MKRMFCVFSLLIFVTACNVDNSVEEYQKVDKSTIPLVSQEKESIEDEIKKLIDNMSIDEKIGQLLIVGFENPKISEREKKLIQTHKIGGFILFQRNITSYEQTLVLLNSLKALNKNNKFPLFLSIDEEGGRVSRLNSIFKNLFPVSDLGLKNSKELAFKYGQIQASKLLALGFNINFSPVLDVNSNPENKVIADRSISGDPEKVALLGAELSQSMMKSGIIPVGKHYPGHGDTSEDSHFNLPIIKKTENELEEVELIPFKYAIKNGMPSLMIGHLYIESLSKDPASISSEIITDLLRNKQGFKGVVISDDLTMGAISESYEIKDAVVNFLKAGGDIALIGHGPDTVFEVIESIKVAVEKELITQSDIDEKLFRIISMKRRFNLEDTPSSSIDVEKLNNRIDKYLIQGE